MRWLKSALDEIERRYRPTQRQWGELAIRAAVRARLCAEDVTSLRTNLDNQYRIDEGGR